jgi:hypothetical protein
MLTDARTRGHAAEQGIVVVGLDRNSRRLVRAATRLGWRVLAVDMGTDAREGALLEPLAGVRGAREDGLVRAIKDGFEHACWATGLVDDAAVRVMREAQSAGQITRPVHAVAWDEFRDRIGFVNGQLMREALTRRGRLAG